MAIKQKFPVKLDRTYLIAALVIPIVHLYLGYVGLSTTFVNGASVFWPSLGVFLAAMLLLGYRVWPILFVSDFIVSHILFFPNNLLISLIIPAVNLITPFTGTFLINRFIKRHNFLERSQDVFKFIILTIPTPLISSLLAAVTLCTSGIAPWAAFAEVCRTWLASDSTGILVVTPLLLAWLQKSELQKKFDKQQIIEFVFVLVWVIALDQIAFSGGYPIEYMVIPPLIWSAFRFEARVSTLLVLIVSAIAVFGTVRGFGSFAKQASPNESLILLQSFICVIAITTFVISAVTNENRKAERKLRQANDELEQRVEERTTELNEAKNSAEVANQAKSEFLANMSHELRTPLNGVLGYAQVLSAAPNLTEQQQHGIDIIYNCGSHLLTLIEDVLDLSKIEARKMELHLSDLHLPAFLQGVEEICRIRAEQKGIQFIYQPPANLPTAIATDEKRLRQVLLNLLGNAIKFTDSGSVTLRVEVTENSQQPSFTQLRFAVEDTGIGMLPQQLEQIFLPFEQVGDTKRQAEGTGLGLAITKKIVEIMGGDIHVKSLPKVGSTFEFEIECSLATNWIVTNTVTTGRIAGYTGDRRSILIVDDRWENRSVIVNLLQPLGFTVIEASNGQEGLEKADRVQPDLIITDLLMPIMNGWDFLALVRQSETLKDVPIVVSSASVYDADRQKSLAAGGNDFLAKPVQVEELYRLLAKHLQLDWIYAEAKPIESAIATSTELAVPPLSELSDLLEYAKRGQIKGIQKELERLAQLDENYQPFVNKLSSLVKEFNIQKIRQFLQEKAE
ncbi:MASE1 domain-containing protein [Coleofasciculus sp. H7-2]|uniref:MASE1 domain-containing protein n=1 Tax=Coleofasciculus sp. H7-2 TaxID=3351545 RepID=UPI00366FBA80